ISAGEFRHAAFPRQRLKWPVLLHRGPVHSQPILHQARSNGTRSLEPEEIPVGSCLTSATSILLLMNHANPSLASLPKKSILTATRLHCGCTPIEMSSALRIGFVLQKISRLAIFP